MQDGTPTPHGANAGAAETGDGEAADVVDQEADDDTALYLVDTAALQFVLLNTAASLQREVADQQAQIDALLLHAGDDIDLL